MQDIWPQQQAALLGLSSAPSYQLDTTLSLNVPYPANTTFKYFTFTGSQQPLAGVEKLRQKAGTEESKNMIWRIWAVGNKGH